MTLTKPAFGCAIALVLALGAVPAGAGGGKKQTVEGSIALPARHPDGCYTGLQRHVTSLSEGEMNGVVGYTFDVDKKTWKKPFALQVTGGAGPIDLDLAYYLDDFASRDEWLNDPTPAPPATVNFEEHKEGGEAGAVPEFAVKAIVCIYASEAGAGVGAEFTYTAGKGVKPPKE